MSAAVSHPTAEALLKAGLTLAEEQGFAQMTVDGVVAAAGVSKGTFYVHFSDRAAFLIAIHRRFHDDLRAQIAAASAGLPAGKQRLARAVTAYLDGCLRARAVKALLLEARSEPAVAAEVRRSDARFARDAERAFQAMGFEDAPAAARLFVAVAAEAALAELDAGRKRPDVRRALWRFAQLEPA